MLFYHYFVFTIIVITCMHNASGCIQVNNSQFDPGKRYTSLRVSVGKTIQLKSNIGSCRLWPPLIIKYCTFHVYKSAIQPEQGSTADALGLMTCISRARLFFVTVGTHPLRI